MTVSLRRLLTNFRDWLVNRKPESATLPSVVARKSVGSLAASERVSRFIFSKSLYWASNKKAKPSAFDPGSKPELSTAHITGMTQVDIWELSKEAITGGSGRDKVRAHAAISVDVVISEGLEAIRDNNPFERHTVLVGWPSVPDEVEQKRRRLGIALKLSQASELQIATPPITRS